MAWKQTLVIGLAFAPATRLLLNCNLVSLVHVISLLFLFLPDPVALAHVECLLVLRTSKFL